MNISARPSRKLPATDRGGDNFIVKVTLKFPDGDKDNAKTGVMSVWKRIDLEYAKMDVGKELKFDELNKYFAMAFVTWNIAPVREIPGINPLFPDLAPTDLVKKPRTKDAKGAENPEEHPRGQFQHAGEGGWFIFAASQGVTFTGIGLLDNGRSAVYGAFTNQGSFPDGLPGVFAGCPGHIYTRVFYSRVPLSGRRPTLQPR